MEYNLDMFDDFDTQPQSEEFEEYYDDEEDLLLDDTAFGVIIDDGDEPDNADFADENGWSPEDFWFNPNGGLTADAYNFLDHIDSERGFV